MSRHVKLVNSSFQFNWKIMDFARIINTRSFDLDSSRFNLKCMEVTTWSLELFPTFIENDYKVSCYLKRLSDSDELQTLTVSLTIHVGDERGSHHFRKRIPLVTLDNKNEYLILQDLFSKSDFENCHYHGSIVLHFIFYVTVNPMQTSNFNFSPGLQMLSTDMEKLYCSKYLKEATIIVKNSLFFVHLAVLHVRWPNFSDYLKQFPNLITKNDLVVFHSIQLEVLIQAAVKEKLDNGLSKNFLEEEEGKINEILTPEILNYLLEYTYTGRCNRLESRKIPNLIKLCQCFQFKRLLKKYQETPAISKCCSKALQSHYILDWSREDGIFWESTNFKPFVQIIEPHKMNSGLLELTLIIENDEFIMNFKNLEKRNPVSISCAIKLKHENGFTHDQIFNSCQVGFNNEIWPVKSGMTKNDVLFRNFSIDVTFHYCHVEPRWVKKKFVIKSEIVWNQPLHLFSHDFLECYSHDIMPDMTIIAKGKVLNVHKYILCARSAQFQVDLGNKLSRDYRFVHLVSGIKFSILDDMLAYMYSGRVEMKDVEDVNALLQAATRFKLEHLMKKCEHYLAVQHTKNVKAK